MFWTVSLAHVSLVQSGTLVSRNPKGQTEDLIIYIKTKWKDILRSVKLDNINTGITLIWCNCKCVFELASLLFD